MKKVVLSILLASLPPASAGKLNHVAVLNVPGMVAEVRASRVVVKRVPSGKVTWTKAVKGNGTIQALLSGHTVLVVTHRSNPPLSEISAYRLEDGKSRWERSLDGTASTRGDKFLISYVSSGEGHFFVTLVLRQNDGQELQQIPGNQVAENRNRLLFWIENTVNGYEPAHLKYVVYDVGVNERTPLEYVVQQRPGCGEISKDTLKPGDWEHYSHHFVYATRQDNCGAFVFRFDWTQQGKTALVYPKPG